MSNTQAKTTNHHYYFGLKAKAALAATTVLAAGSMMLGVLAQPAHAATDFYYVTDTGDLEDAVPGDGMCDTYPQYNGNQCSLRAAIQESNANTNGNDKAIGFTESVKGNYIEPQSELPAITKPVNIHGDYQGRVYLNGSEAPSGANGLVIKASNTVVSGLTITGFGGDGIELQDVSNVQLRGNFIGTYGEGYISDLGNGGTGVNISGNSDDNTVGGSYAGAGNVISENFVGVRILSGNSSATGNVVEGNKIGTDKDGNDADLGNATSGVEISGASNTTVQKNTVAYNDLDGVKVQYVANGNRVSQNSIFSNGDLGIDLNGDGKTDNDQYDNDGSANGSQNYPVITSATTANGKTLIKGDLNSLPNKLFKIEFFSSPAGGDEGKTYLGQKTVGPGGGNYPFSFEVSQAVPQGHVVTATATVNDGLGAGNTSEFSAPKTVAPNEAPDANYDFYSVRQGNTLTVSAAKGVLKNDADPNGDQFTAEHLTAPAHGTLALNPDGSFTYKPKKSFKGTDTFTYYANDDRDAASEAATVTIKVRRR